jgi:hypothetical protein
MSIVKSFDEPKIWRYDLFSEIINCTGVTGLSSRILLSSIVKPFATHITKGIVQK